MARGSIKKRAKDSYTIRYDGPRGPDGKRNQRTETLRGTKREAEAFLAHRVDEVNSGRYIVKSSKTVGECLDRFVDDIPEDAISPITRKGYLGLIKNHLKPKFGKLTLAQLKHSDIYKFYKDLAKGGRRDGRSGGLSPKTIKNMNGVFHEALEDACLRGELMHNPTERVSLPTYHKETVNTLKVHELRLLMKAVENTELYMPTLLAATTGLRRGEILALCWDDIDLSLRTLTVEHAIIVLNSKEILFKDPKTKYSRRTITLPNITVEALKKHKQEQEERRTELELAPKDLKPVCATPELEVWHPEPFSRAFDQMKKKLSIGPFRFHDIRHTHAELLLDHGINAKVVSLRLGHATVAFTLETYVHHQPITEKLAANVMDELLDGASLKTTAASIGEGADVGTKSDSTITLKPEQAVDNVLSMTGLEQGKVNDLMGRVSQLAEDRQKTMDENAKLRNEINKLKEEIQNHNAEYLRLPENKTGDKAIMR